MKRAKERVTGTEQQQLPGPQTERPRPSFYSMSICFLTRGSAESEWHVWNTSSMALNLRPGDRCTARILNRNFESDSIVVVQALIDLVLPGSSSKACTLDRDVRFHTDSYSGREHPGHQHLSVLQQAADQDKLSRLCLSKGVDCFLFLNHYVKKPEQDDEDTRLGARLQVLFMRSVEEMLRRQYDVMHHYALFSRALSLHLTSEVRSGPPEVKDMVAPGGLLDRSVEEHVALHGIPLVGSDHLSFSRWGYYEGDADPAVDPLEAERSEGKTTGEEPKSSVAEAETPLCERNRCSGEKKDEGGPEDGEEEDFAGGTDKESGGPDLGEAHGVGETYIAFNNLTGTLTDGPKGFPYAYTMFTGAELRFNDLVD